MTASSQLKTVIEAITVTDGSYYVIDINPPGDFIELYEQINFNDDTNVVIQSRSTPPKKIVRTANAGLFNYVSSTGGQQSITLSNIVIDGGGDGKAEAVTGRLFNLSNHVDLYMGYNDTSAVIEHSDITGTIFDMIGISNNSSLHMINSSSIRHCFIKSATINISTFILIDNNSTFIMSDSSTIHDNKSSWVVDPGYRNPAVVYIRNNSVMKMINNSSIYDIVAYWGIRLNDNSYFSIDNEATIHDCSTASALIRSSEQSLPEGLIVEILGGRIYNNNNAIVFFENTRGIMYDGSIDNNKSDGITLIGIVLTTNGKFEMRGGSVSHNTGNTTAGDLGGAFTLINTITTAELIITGGSIVGNKAYKGGAINCLVPGDAAGKRVIIKDDTGTHPPIIKDNIAITDGGAIWMADPSKLTLGPNVVFENNKASRYIYYGAIPEGASVDTTGLVYTEPLQFAFNNADVELDPSDPTATTGPIVVYDTQGAGAAPPDQLINPFGNQLITQPVAPHRNNLVFTGWYTDPVGGVRWDFNTMPISAGMAASPSKSHLYLYAHWRELTVRERCKIRWTGGKWYP